MAKGKKVIKLVVGVIVGFIISQICINYNTSDREFCGFSLNSLISDTSSKNAETPFAAAPATNLLFVGVMTASKYLETRAKAVYETWGQEVPGKILFFSSETSTSNSIPLVALEGVDDSYPPQKKSFAMLKYMHDNHIDDFEWFLRADDDVYVRTDRVQLFLQSIDSRKPWFIGQTGRGNSEEFGLLSLESDENFCMGGPGVILSRETLKRIAPYINECLANLYTNHEDVELGRCVKKFAGVSCTWSYEMQVILYHNHSGPTAFTGDLKQKEVHRAITLHPIKQPQHMHRLHNYFKGLKLQDNQQESLTLHRDIATSMEKLGVNEVDFERANLAENLPLFTEPQGSEEYLGDTKLLGVPVGLNRFKTQSLDEVLEWELISKSLYSAKDLNPKRRMGSALKEGLDDVTREVMELINSYSKQRGRIIDFKEILYAYWRVNPNTGVDLILDLLLIYRKYRGHKMTVHVRRHAYVQQTFTGIEIRESDLVGNTPSESKTAATNPLHHKIIDNFISKLSDNIPVIFDTRPKTSHKLINFILPISGKHSIFKRFLKMYESRCILKEEVTRLTVVLYKSEKSPYDYASSLQLISDTRTKHPGHEIRVVTVNEPFSRGRALQYGVNSAREEDLLLFIDVDIVFDNESLTRVRSNTVKGRKLYFPIVYSTYNPNVLNKTYPLLDYEAYSGIIDNYNGFWRLFGFGIASLYKSDYFRVGGFNMTIFGWGFEDVTFYDGVVRSNLTIVRAADPGLIHVYHPVDCDSNLEFAQKSMCLGTQTSTLASLRELQIYYKKYRHLFFR